jgi:uncharacterized SAM-binding protein YcdF (DUF218 family)
MLVLRSVTEVVQAPAVLALFLALIGFVLWAWRPRLGTTLMVAAAGIALLGSLSPVSRTLLGPLEARYPPLELTADLQGVRYVVVLGSSYRPDGALPVTAALDYAGLTRIVEGVRLMKRLRSARLVVSGGGDAPSAVGYAELARDLGIPQESIIALDTTLNTSGEAMEVARLLGTEAFLLVTSAYHMPRAVRLMERAGAHPIAAPTDQQLRSSSNFAWSELLPDADALGDTEAALHEYLGLAAIAMGLD